MKNLKELLFRQFYLVLYLKHQKSSVSNFKIKLIIDEVRMTKLIFDGSYRLQNVRYIFIGILTSLYMNITTLIIFSIIPYHLC